ncbi:hypothetical protein COV61_03860, partial [Candidatus Micrarchaeota archaeon CG11_big_fil_rev_8_21_14_0_20_47_5]
MQCRRYKYLCIAAKKGKPFSLFFFISNAMIRSISLKNWRSHEHSTFEFSPGVNLLTGIMGSGKSSVMEAMCFALFGTFPQSSRGRVKLEELSGGRGETQVALAFDAGEEMYEVERRIEKGAEANLRKGKMLVCTGAKKVNDSIKRVLEVDYEAFVRAIYSEQNQIDRLLSLEPGRRKAEIDELLGLDKFEAARASATG